MGKTTHERQFVIDKYVLRAGGMKAILEKCEEFLQYTHPEHAGYDAENKNSWIHKSEYFVVRRNENVFLLPFNTQSLFVKNIFVVKNFFL